MGDWVNRSDNATVTKLTNLMVEILSWNIFFTRNNIFHEKIERRNK